MSLPSEIQALVVGAGPVGLVTAITLSSLGVQVALVDSALKNKNGSRAGIVHPRTLEVLDTIGLAKPIMDAGIQSEGIAFHGKHDDFFDIDMTQLSDATRFPMSVIIPQFEVERILQEAVVSLGIQMFRGRTVTDMHQADCGVDVAFEDGSDIRTRYVVGADGSHSTVRRLSGIEFRDPNTGAAYHGAADPSLQMVFADTYLEEPLPSSIPRDKISMYLDNLMMLAPLRPDEPSTRGSHSSWRVMLRIPNGGPEPPHSPTVEYLQNELNKRNQWETKVTISSVTASSRYRVRTAVASTFFQRLGDGHVLLAGDAAHVHSPAGGQGMNLGICDAVALGHVIHSHVKAEDSEERDDLLRGYAEERRERAIAVIDMVKDLTAVIGVGGGWRRPLANLALKAANHILYTSRQAAWNISGLSNRTAAKSAV